MKTDKRDVGLDLIRIVAFVSVLSVHFFLNTSFYTIPVNRMKMYIMVTARNCFMVCVPLFLLLTGYLMSVKEFTENKDFFKHLRKIKKVLLTYVLATIVIFLFKKFYFGESIGIKDALFNILSYSQYSWYVELYLGLFLLIPFLNILWKGLSTKSQRLFLVIALSILTVLPSLLNVFDFYTPNALLKPFLSSSQNQVVPAWWVGIYPITYYYIGAYLRKDVDIKKLNSLILFGLLILSFGLCGIINVWKSYGTELALGVWNDWGSFLNTANTVLLFLFIYSFDYGKTPVFLRKLLGLLSELTFGAYILSYISDQILYPKLNENVSEMFDKFLRAPIVVGKSVLISLFLALIVDLIIKGINFIFSEKCFPCKK